MQVRRRRIGPSLARNEAVREGVCGRKGDEAVSNSNGCLVDKRFHFVYWIFVGRWVQAIK